MGDRYKDPTKSTLSYLCYINILIKQQYHSNISDKVMKRNNFVNLVDSTIIDVIIGINPIRPGFSFFWVTCVRGVKRKTN